MYSVNGGGFSNVTVPDNTNGSAGENFYFEFNDSDNGNKLEGYTVRVQAQNTNLDITDSLFYFSPFNSNSPANNEATTSALPTFDFSVNKQRTWLRDYLQNYQIQVARDVTNDFKVYIDYIPVDFYSNKNLNDNRQRSKYLNVSTNNGIYETDKLSATYLEESSRVQITPKDVKTISFPYGTKLAPGVYKWKVLARDKVGHSEETQPRTITILGKPVVTTYTTTVLGTNTEQLPLDQQPHESMPSASPTPSPSIKPHTNHKLCIWFICLSSI